MSQESMELGADAIEYITTVKFPAARAAVKVLRDAGVPVVHYGSLGNNDVKPELRGFFDLDLIVRMDDIDLFSTALEDAGYRMLLDNPYTGTAVEATPEWQEHERYDLGGCPAGYALPTKPVPDLWVHFRTTWQHWPLLFVDLGHWFGAAETVTVLGDTEIQRAPLWARLLWETDETAWEVRRHHPDARKDLEDVVLFSRAPGVDWDLVAERIVQYDAEAVQRQTRLIARIGDLERTTVVAPIPDQKGRVINHCYHLLQAVEDYYPGTVPASFLATLRPLTEGRIMVIDMRDDPDWTIRYDFAARHDVVVVPDFTIKEQLDRYGNFRAVELVSKGIVKPAIYREDRPEGPWDLPSRDDLFAVFAPL